VRWVEVVEQVAAAGKAAGRAAWAAPRPPVRVAIASARILTAGTASRTRQVCLATGRNARSAGHRWSVKRDGELGTEVASAKIMSDRPKITCIVDNADADHLRQVREVLLEMESVQRVYLNHCSGEAALHSLLLTLGPDIVRPCPAGTRLT
jgi:hypothetical protein